jgi:hypothetical protein
MHKEALAAAETVDNDYLRAQVLDMLGLDAATVGDVTVARDRFSAAAQFPNGLFDYEGSAYCLSGLAGLALHQDRAEASARLIGASDYVRRTVGGRRCSPSTKLNEVRSRPCSRRQRLPPRGRRGANVAPRRPRLWAGRDGRWSSNRPVPGLVLSSEVADLTPAWEDAARTHRSGRHGMG